MTIRIKTTETHAIETKTTSEAPAPVRGVTPDCQDCVHRHFNDTDACMKCQDSEGNPGFLHFYPTTDAITRIESGVSARATENQLEGNARMEPAYRGMDKNLQRLELRFRKLEKSFVEKGDILSQIKSERLYELRGFHSFKAYHQAIFHIKPSMASKLMRGARIWHVLRENYRGYNLPQNETHVRPLTDPELTDGDIALIWASVVESGKVTQKNVKSAVELYKNPVAEINSKASEGAKNTGSEDVQTSGDTEVLGKDEPSSDSPFSDNGGGIESNPVFGSGTEGSSEETPEEPSRESEELPEENLPAQEIQNPGGSEPENPGEAKPENPRESKAENQVQSKGDLLAENKALKAELAELELKIQMLKSEPSGGTSAPKTKMSLMLYKAGYMALRNTISEDQQGELDELYFNLTS